MASSASLRGASLQSPLLAPRLAVRRAPTARRRAVPAKISCIGWVRALSTSPRPLPRLDYESTPTTTPVPRFLTGGSLARAAGPGGRPGRAAGRAHRAPRVPPPPREGLRGARGVRAPGSRGEGAPPQRARGKPSSRASGISLERVPGMKAVLCPQS
jgi:hypothetical protein